MVEYILFSDLSMALVVQLLDSDPANSAGTLQSLEDGAIIPKLDLELGADASLTS